ncbi:MAG: hypothetical protein KKI02_08015 [Planctomycetes bacterium]|nr:hypothetical protein [Planctomycetota bacterium]
MRVPGVLSALAPMLLCLVGCSQGMETRSFQPRVIDEASPDDVLLAAQVLLRREFGRVDIEPGARRIVSQPVEYQTSSESGTARDLYGGRSTMRRIAHFAVAKRGDGSIARLRIEVERMDTARREAFRPDQGRISDAPSQTPIERDAATTTRQNTVWTFVKRDRRLERALLAELQEQFAPEPDEMPAEQSAVDRPAETP